jgi:hypothetical protein
LYIFIEVTCCWIFFESFGEIRRKGWINTVQFWLLYCVVGLYAYELSGYFVLRQIVGIFSFSLFMLWHVRISLKKSFVLAILFDALLLAMDYLAYLAMGCLSLGKNLSAQKYEISSTLVYLLANKFSIKI